jgi:hypothetical protein
LPQRALPNDRKSTPNSIWTLPSEIENRHNKININSMKALTFSTRDEVTR